MIWKSWLQLLLALGFVAVGARMLADALRDPRGGKAGQVWTALAIVVMFAGCAAIFAHELAHAPRPSAPGAGRNMAPTNADGPLVAVYSTVWTAIALAGCVTFAGAGVMLVLASVAGGADGIGWPGLIVGPLTAVVFGGFAIIGAALTAARGLGRPPYPHRRRRPLQLAQRPDDRLGRHPVDRRPQRLWPTRD